MQVTDHSVRISLAKIEIDKPLELGSDVSILVKGSITKLEDSDNQDGTIGRTYVVKGEIGELIANE